MKQFLSFIFLFISMESSEAQQSYFNYLELGPYKINFADSIIYDHKIPYDQYGYSGSSPLFVQIWFPSANGDNGDFLTLGDYKSDRVPAELKEVYERLNTHMDEILIRDVIEYDLAADEPIDYGHLTSGDILEKIKLIPTQSTRASLNEKPAYPSIVYHHGSQGLSWENSVMGEYFASHGYVFISSNFHLPYENTMYGLLPYHLEAKNKHDQSSAKALIHFARSITNSNAVFFVGHSWGAQEGWCFLHDSTFVDAFVSMETTIEYKSDTTQIREFWPYVYDALKVKKHTFLIPILSFAAADNNTNFEFFRGLSSKEMIFASHKEPFEHNSYTSMYMMRYFLHPGINLSDAEILQAQIVGYAEHLKLTLAFFEAIQKNEKFDRKQFQQRFHFD